ncbi:MAG: hypothetical protein M1142_02620 [Patescibacteria group bacterium]|nr:hypothetical protein [Patescibacteria group bacterium]
MDNDKTLLKIVKTWNIKMQPEYRGFRCADCQRYLHKAWHHYLNYGGFKTPVHFCNNCQKKFGSKTGILKIFTCDKCGRNMFKTFHIWTKEGKNLVEIHLCKECFNKSNPAKIH